MLRRDFPFPPAFSGLATVCWTGLTKGQLESGLWYPLKPVMPQLQQAQLPPLNVQNEVPCEDCSIQIHHPVRSTPRNPFSCPYCIIHKNIQSLSELLQKTKLLTAQHSCIMICETQVILPLLTFPDPTRTECPSTFPGRTEYPNIWVGSCCKQAPNDGNVISPNCIMKSCWSKHISGINVAIAFLQQ